MAQLIPVGGFGREYTVGPYVSGGSSDLGGTSQTVFKALVPFSKFRAFFGNYTLPSGSFEQSSTLAVLALQAGFQAGADSSSVAQLKFGGVNQILLQPGQSAPTDFYTYGGTIAQNSFFAIRAYVQVPSGGSFPLGCFIGPNESTLNLYTKTPGSNNYVQNTDVNSTNNNGSNQLLTTGAASSWYSSQIAAYGPLYVEGFATDGITRPIVGIVGDSIHVGYFESLDYSLGAANRAMVALNLPYYNVAHAGEKLSSVYLGGPFYQRMNRIQRATCIITNYGTNDFFGGATFANVQSNSLLFWKFLSGNGAQIIPVTILPRVTYTGNVYPVSQQTYATGESYAQQFNAWLRAPSSAGAGNSATYDAAAVGVTIPYIIDAASYVETDSTNSTPGGPTAPNTGGYWWCGTGNNTAYTADGTHPTTGGTLLILPAYIGASTAIQATTPLSTPTSTIIF